MATELAEFETERECGACERATLHAVFVRYTSEGPGDVRAECEECGTSTDLDGEEFAGLVPATATATPPVFDTYAGPEYSINQPWSRSQLRPGTVNLDRLPSISVSGYTVDLVPRLTGCGEVLTARMEFDGQELSGVVLENRAPDGWSVHYGGIGTEYRFATVFDAMAHAMHYLV